MSEEFFAAGSPAPENSAAPPAGWLDGLPEDLKGLAEAKGWKGPAEVLKSYRHLEEYLGADKAERGLTIPRDPEDREGYDRIYQALGRPEEPGGYGLEKVLEGRQVDAALVGRMSRAMHEAGLSQQQAARVSTAWQEAYDEIISRAESDYQAGVAEVRAQYGPSGLEQAKRGLVFAAGGEDQARLLESHLGVRLAAAVGRQVATLLSEDRMVGGLPGPDLASADGARRKIAEKQSDPAFLERYLQGDPQAVDDMTALYRLAATGL